MDDVTDAIAAMNDDDLLAQINGFDPYDVEFARRFRAQAARLAEVERERDSYRKTANELAERVMVAEGARAAVKRGMTDG